MPHPSMLYRSRLSWIVQLIASSHLTPCVYSAVGCAAAIVACDYACERSREHLQELRGARLAATRAPQQSSLGRRAAAGRVGLRLRPGEAFCSTERDRGEGWVRSGVGRIPLPLSFRRTASPRVDIPALTGAT